MGDLNEPVLPGTAATDYERYLRTDELLALQKTPEDVVHRDEHLFQAVHQSSELWLKLACLEIEAATALVDGRPGRRGDTPRAPRVGRDAPDHDQLTCSSTCRRLTTQSCERRWATARASTRQASAGFTACRRRSVPPSSVCSRGADARPSSTSTNRDTSYEDIYQLAEQMTTWDERTILWRFQHLKTVERIIGGNVIGTQGTPVEVLGKRIDVRFFPELWQVRDEITRRSELGTDGHGG